MEQINNLKFLFFNGNLAIFIDFYIYLKSEGITVSEPFHVESLHDFFKLHGITRFRPGYIVDSGIMAPYIEKQMYQFTPEFLQYAESTEEEREKLRVNALYERYKTQYRAFVPAVVDAMCQTYKPIDTIVNSNTIADSILENADIFKQCPSFGGRLQNHVTLTLKCFFGAKKAGKNSYMLNTTIANVKNIEV